MSALEPLLEKAFHRARGLDANAEIAAQRERHGIGGEEALSYELVLDPGDTLQQVAEKVLPKLVYFLDCRGVKLDAAGSGVFLSVFVGASLYFVHSHDFIARVAPASGLTIPELIRKYGAASTG